MEVWADIPSLNGKYRASNLGRIKRIDGLILGQSPNGNYMKVNISLCKKRYIKYVHRLVAETFVSNPDNLPEVNHIDYNTMNNSASNLEWSTKADNIKHSFDKGRRSNFRTNPAFKGRAIPLAEPKNLLPRKSTVKQIAAYTLTGELVNIFPSVVDVAEQNNLHISTIRKCARGEYSNAYGYIWKYID